MSNTKQSSDWVYTVNNYTEDDIVRVKSLVGTKHRCCKEIGDTGTPHLQGAIRFKRKYSEKSIRKLIPRAHWEIAKTNDPENYCIKGEIIIDIQPQQGKRTDLETAMESLKETRDVQQIVQYHPTVFLKYHNGLLRYLQDTQPCITKWTPTEVIVCIGKPGKGKTRYAYENFPELYSVPPVYDGKVYFDGYIGQTTILLDDYYGSLSYQLFLQITDGYPLQVPVKGSFVKRNWNRVIITSNSHPETWYPHRQYSAIKRRITQIIFFDDKKTHAIENSPSIPETSPLCAEEDQSE